MRRTRLVASLAVASAASASLLFAAPALADNSYPPTDCTSMGSTQTTDGSADSGTACGFDPGENVRADGASVPVFLGSTIASASGRATVHFTIPADFPAGLHHLIMTGQTSGHTVIQAFTVTAAGASAPASSSSSGSSLPFTGGNDVWQMTLAGVVLVGVGGSLLVVRRRRTHAAAV